MEKLSQKKCIPCQIELPPLSESKKNELLAQLNGWTIVESHHLYKSYAFKDFSQALDWVNKIGELAEVEGHHPDLELGWGYVNVKMFTHNIDNLSESDFIFAAKVDELL